MYTDQGYDSVLLFSQLEYKSDILSSLPTLGKLGQKYPNLVITLWKNIFRSDRNFHRLPMCILVKVMIHIVIVIVTA
jgi:hypothetical protein